MDALIIGAGYVAKHLYKQLKSDSPASTVYTASRAERFLNNSQHISIDLDNADSLKKLPIVSNTSLNIFYLTPPKPEGLDDTRIKNFICYINTVQYTKLKMVYISTSGVYGNKNGDWVTEETATNPINDRAKRRVSAEQQLLTLSAQNKNIQSLILRVPGIYGPGRLPIEKIKQRGKIISETECGYTNLIHAEDLACICLSAATNGIDKEIYNVSDTQPVKSSYYYKLVAKLAELPTPEEVSFEEALKTFDSKRLSFLRESRRLDVTKMQSQLRPTLAFTNLEKGILQSMADL